MSRSASRCISIIGCVLLLGMSFAGCGAPDVDPTEPPQPPPPTATPEEPPLPSPTPEEETNTPVPDDADPYPQPIMAAIAAAAEEAGVEVDDVRVLSYTEREWPSTALGCPQPGFSYAQVVTPGYLVQLSADGRQYEYHTNLSSGVVLCSTS